LVTLLSQLPKPVLHVIRHALLMHDGVPLTAEQPLPHIPQWAALVVVSVSHPAMVMSQSARPALHWHVPAVQLWFAAHGRLHAPQCALLVWKSMQPPAQNVPEAQPHALI
jgi:hypothetical protein